MIALTVVVFAILGVGARVYYAWLWQRHREAISHAITEVQPLLSALEAYRADHGSYPSALDDLVPDYLPAIPEPPFDFPVDEWQYVSGREEVRDWAWEAATNEAPLELPEQVYSLWVWVPSGYIPLSGMFSDALVYHSHGEYARFAYGGVLMERIDGWAYYHE